MTLLFYDVAPFTWSASCALAYTNFGFPHYSPPPKGNSHCILILNLPFFPLVPPICSPDSAFYFGFFLSVLLLSRLIFSSFFLLPLILAVTVFFFPPSPMTFSHDRKKAGLFLFLSTIVLSLPFLHGGSEGFVPPSTRAVSFLHLRVIVSLSSFSLSCSPPPPPERLIRSLIPFLFFWRLWSVFPPRPQRS